MVTHEPANPFPQFLLHIGAARAASTLLQNWFLAHPQLRYVVRGIAGLETTTDVGGLAEQFLTAKQVRYLVTSEEAFSGTWLPRETARATDATRKMWGKRGRQNVTSRKPNPYRVYEGAPHEILRAKCLLLKQLFPSAHVLYITRGLEATLRSYYTLNAQRGFWNKPTDIMGYLKASPELGAMLDYDFVIALYREQYGTEFVHVLPYELLRDNANEFFGALENELGLEHFPFSTRRVNASLNARELYWQILFSRWAARLERLTKIPFQQAFLRTFAASPRATRTVRLLARSSRNQVALEIDPQFLETFRGCASSLEKNPRYAGYAREYLF